MKLRREPYSRGVSLREHLETIFELRFKGIERATNLARENMEKRLDSMNEFRETLKDQAGRFVTRTEMLAVIGTASAIIIALAAYLRKG